MQQIAVVVRLSLVDHNYTQCDSYRANAAWLLAAPKASGQNFPFLLNFPSTAELTCFDAFIITVESSFTTCCFFMKK